MRIAAAAGALLYVLMWTVVLPPENNPVIDDHLLGAVTLVVLALALAGDTWGLGRTWSRLPLVRSNASSAETGLDGPRQAQLAAADPACPRVGRVRPEFPRPATHRRS